ncbi:MAG: Ig-like domain-containing protein [Lachnospiraceae bacterium]|nr:Ig-like domain-containing protein [Lachnospiraceae bacterium]
MKRKLYRFLSSMLTASMLLSDFGTMAVSAAPETAVVAEAETEASGEESEPEKETASGNGSVSSDRPKATNEETEIPEVDGDEIAYLVNTEPGHFGTRFGVTLSGLGEEETADVYLLLTDDETVDLTEGTGTVSENMMPYLYDGHLVNVRENDTSWINLGMEGAMLKPGTTYYYRLLRKDGDQYRYLDTTFDTFQTMPLSSISIQKTGEYETYTSVRLYWSFSGFCWDDEYFSQIRFFADKSENTEWTETLANNTVSINASKLAGVLSSNEVYGQNGDTATDFPAGEAELEPGTEYTGVLLLCADNGSDDVYYVLGEPTTIETKSTGTVSANASANSYTANIKAVFGGEDEYDEYDPLNIPYELMAKYYGMETFLIYTADAEKDLFEGKACADSLEGYETCTSMVKDRKLKKNKQMYMRLMSQYSLGYDSALKPATTYRYRIAVPDGERYWFVTPEQSFTTGAAVTQSRVNIDSVSLRQYGFEAERIGFRLNNWGEEEIIGMELVDENGNVLKRPATDDEDEPSTFWTDDDGEVEEDEEGFVTWYGGLFSTSANSATIRIIVYTGENGEKTNIDYPLSAEAYKRRDPAERKISVSVDALTNALKAELELEPYYGIDYYEATLYYKLSTDAEYISETREFDSDDDDETLVSNCRLDLNGLSQNASYDYYLTVTSRWDPDRVILSYGSATEPKKINTGTVSEYSRDDFKDKALYDELVRQGYTMTNETLEGLVDLSIFSVFGDTPIVSLEDLPEKMPSLTSVRIYSHDIKDISPLLKLKKLKTVDLDFNEVETLPDLSGVSWRYLSLAGNYVQYEAAGNAGYHSGEWHASYRRTKELGTEKTAYIDRNGKYPLLFNFPGKADSRTWTMTVSMNGVSRTYDSTQTDKVVCSGSEWTGKAAFIVPDAKSDFSLEKGQEYTFNVSISDPYHEQPIVSGSCSIRFADTDYDLPDQYLAPTDKLVYIEQSISMDAIERGVYSAEVRKGDTVYLKNKAELGACEDTKAYKLYPSMEIPGDNGLDYSITSVYGKFTACRILSAGDYDLHCFNEAGEEVSVIRNKIHVTNDPVVLYDEGLWADAGCEGRYVYATVYGYNLDLSTPPVITDGTTEYTNAVSIKQYAHSIDEEYYDEEEEENSRYTDYYYYYANEYVFKLEKNANWDKILKADPATVYYIEFKGKNVKDLRTDGIEGKSWTAKELWDLDAYANSSWFEVESVVYNWKTDYFELRVDTTSANQLLNVEIGRYDYSDEEDEEYVLYGTASGRPDAKGNMKLRFKKPDGSPYVPTDGENVYLNFYSDKHEYLGDYDMRVEYYNYPNETYGGYSSASKMSLLPDRWYYQEGSVTLNLTASGLPEAHKTDKLFVNVLAVSLEYDEEYHYYRYVYNKVTTISLNKAKSKDGKDYFTVTGWKPDNNFPVGDYNLGLFETVDGKDVNIASSITIHVVKERYTMTAQSLTWFDDGTGAKLYASAPLLTDKTLSDQKERDKFVADNGLAVHVYDSNKKPVAVETSLIQLTWPDGRMIWDVKGLDPEEYGYYFAITVNGQCPKSDGGSDYYDSQYGEWYDKSYYCYYHSAKGGIYGMTVSDEQYAVPYTVRFYKYSDPRSMVKSITLKSTSIYYFTPEDMEGIDSDTIYTVNVINKYGEIIDNTIGYFWSNPEAFRDKSKNVALKSLAITRARAMEVGESLQLSVEFTPSDVTNKTVYWSSSDTDVAVISSYGMVTAKKLGTTTITLKSSDGKKTAHFVLNVIDKSKSLYVEFEKEERYVYTGEKITPAVAVYSGGRKLMEGTDYKVSYSNNLNASSAAKVTVTGVTVPGKVVRTFTINRRPLDDEEVTAAELIVASGKSANPVLYLGKYKLSSKDFSFDSKKKFTANGTLTLSGQGNFMGTRVLDVTVGTAKTLKVKSFSPVSRTYDGTEQRLGAKELVVVDSKSGAELKEGVDYVLSYQDDITSAGVVKVRILGMGLYNSSVAKSYKIQALKASGVSVNVAAEVNYDPNGAKPSVEVLYKNRTLTAGKDYKVSFKKNKEAGKAEAKVTFLGNYKGTSGQIKNFHVKAISLSANSVSINCPDMAWYKDAKLLSTPYVTLNGMEITKANYTPTYFINGKEITTRKVTQADFGKENSVTVTVKLEAKGKNVKGTATASYVITKCTQSGDLSKAKVEIKKQNGKTVSSIPFTGSPIEMKGEYKLVVTLDGTVLTEGKDYTVSYANNIYKGKAYVIVNGLGDNSTEKTKYYGSKTKNFTITTGTLNWF